jgi:hypothetical protein
MGERLNLCLWFGLGVLFQALFFVRSRADLKVLAICLLIGLCGMIPGKHEHNYALYRHMLFGFGFFSFMSAIFFKNELMPIISEKLVLFYTLIFWYAFFSFVYKSTYFHNILLSIFLVPTIGTILIAFIKQKLNFTLKLCFYSWFVCVVLLMGVFQFSYGNIVIFFKEKGIYWLNSWDSIFAGMAFFYIVANVAYLYQLIPIPAKHQSMKSRMEQWHEFTTFTVNRYEDDQLTYIQALLIIVIQGGLLFLNYQYHLLDPNLVINLMILAPIALLLKDYAYWLKNRIKNPLLRQG